MWSGGQGVGQVCQSPRGLGSNRLVAGGEAPGDGRVTVQEETVVLNSVGVHDQNEAQVTMGRKEEEEKKKNHRKKEAVLPVHTKYNCLSIK